ncbi:MAG: hypothetical protein IT372_36450 [Polyangiaceae bacterium]|nr:hypothetical protein [Polyangiaceae bacterium]
MYSLGAILFELLTLLPLHPKASRGEMLMATLRGANARPSLRASDLDVPPELEEICVRATRTEPGARYASARELHEAIERYLDGDKDQELRGELASRHARAAAAMVVAAVRGGPGAEAARRDALREVGRALALEPTNAEALRALAAVITSPPRRAPAAVEEEVEGLAAARHRIALRYGVAIDLVGVSVTAAALLWMGLRDARVILALVSLTLGSSAFKIIAARARRKRTMRAFGYGAYLLNLLAVLSASRIFGPLFFVPAPVALFTTAYCMVADSGFRRAVMVTGCAGLLAAVGMELAGVAPSSYSFHGGQMTILSQAASLPEIPTLIGLTASNLVLTLAPALMAMRLQRTLMAADRRSVTQAWQLRQLLPDEASALAGQR